LYLKKLEINGFKSFANKTTLDFSVSQNGERSITAIVGPNGSGKSNIADAIRWVMGEQSMKNLRGKKSEDNIFAGSGKKARLGSAQSTLFFDNSDKKIPLDFEEVSVSRKIFRSGESEYLINGSKVRLQDVVDILAKAGIGKESYSIVNQGMADAILNATPLERRSLIEDAAGVKQYQIKKERSLRKLEKTRDNLSRARELAEELKPHLKMLKRQAEKATQGEEIFKKLKEKQTTLFTYLWNNFQEERRTLNNRKDELGIKMMNVQRGVDKLTDEINQESKKSQENQMLLQLEKERNNLRNEANNLERELIVSEGRIEIEKEKQKSLEMIQEIKIKSIPIDIPYIKKEIEQIKSEQEKLIERIEKADKLEDLKNIKELAFAIKIRLHNLDLDVEKGKKEEPEELKREEFSALSDENNAVKKLEERSLEIREELKNLEKKSAEIGEKIESEIKGDREKRQKFFEIERELRIRQEELGKLKDEFNEAKISLAKVEVREEDLRSEVLEALKISPEELKKDKTEPVDKFSFENEINKLKIQLEQIGGIDPLVAEEYKETNERFDFLTRESEDLDRAIVSLKEIIKEMDNKINDVFASTFEEINKGFSKYFRIIFGGGNAHLTKSKVESRKPARIAMQSIAGGSKAKNTETEKGGSNNESEDDLDEENKEEERDEQIGLDISACPPGKRISNLSMLSGGERSLTSLALLFAIISHNPPPFSILDEVEAALDEANSKRFGRIIMELCDNTQFVIITHNRETMRQASLLYGVTMGEDGISKLLSVKLDQVGVGGKIIR
jgi:chromosome segregation protein